MLRPALLALTLASLTLVACSSGGKCDPVLDCNPPVAGCDCSAPPDAGIDADAGTDGGTSGEADGGTSIDRCGVEGGGEIDVTGTWTGTIQTETGTEALTLVLTTNADGFTGTIPRSDPTCGDVQLVGASSGCEYAASAKWSGSTEDEMQLNATLSGNTLSGQLQLIGTDGQTCPPLVGNFTVSRSQ